jgi:protein TonB
MRWAVAASLVFHSFFLGLIFKSSQEKSGQYPPVMVVRLASPPAARGAPTKATTEAPKKAEAPKKKQEATKEKTRMAEVNKRKKPERKKKTQPPPPTQESKTSDDVSDSRGKGLPEGVELGSEFGSASLDASGFDSPYFLNVLFSKIRNRWDNPYEGGDTVRCTIYFVVDRGGRITDSAIEHSSGLASYDQAALRAVLAAKPPPLPNQFGSDELGIHLEFRFLPYF